MSENPRDRAELDRLEARLAAAEAAGRYAVETAEQTARELLDEHNRRVAAETKLAVLDGESCAEERADGNGRCGVCIRCLRELVNDLTPRLRTAKRERDALTAALERIVEKTTDWDEVGAGEIARKALAAVQVPADSL